MRAQKVEFQFDKELFTKCQNLANAVFPANEMLFPTTFDEYKNKYDLLAFFDENDEFIGFSALIEKESFIYLAFFAVEINKQNLGFGGRILEFLQKNYTKPIVLETEKIIKTAPNYDERVRRMNFYKNNGFLPCGYEISYINETYTLYSNKDFQNELKDYKIMYEEFAKSKNVEFSFKKGAND